MILSHKQIQLVSRLLFLLIPYFFIRLGFYFYHIQIFDQYQFSDILLSFIIGIRFDLAGILLLNIPILLTSFFCRLSQKFERILFVSLNSIGFLISVNDYELYSFVGKRLSYDFFLITDDILDQLPQVTLYYWYLPFVAILISVLFYFFDKKFLNFNVRNISQRILIISHLIICSVYFVGIRGGIQNKSINAQTAFIQGSNELGTLVLNTPYFFLRTLGAKSSSKISYFKKDEDLKFILSKGSQFYGEFKNNNNNVVLIILESFSLEYLEQGYTPFLKNLSEKSFYLSKHLANGRRSIESLPSLLCGLPALIDEPISKSIFSSNKFECFPKILKDLGYTNYFYHGGNKGTMGFESYTLSHGFHRYFSREDYPKSQDFDGAWGIYDGPYFSYVADELNKIPKPFLAGIFTLSSHQPYSIPSAFKDKFPKGTLEIHESIGYVDFALKEFFEKIKNESWFKNTLFIITADHAQKLETKKFRNILGSYRVPLLFYHPGYNWGKFNPNKVSQHSDIPFSVLDFLGIQKPLNGMGKSVFSEGNGQAFNYVDGNFYYRIEGDQFFRMNKSGEQQAAHYDWEKGEFSSYKKSTDPYLKAYIQYFINGLIANNLSLYR